MARGFSFSYENESSEHHHVLFNIWYKLDAFDKFDGRYSRPNVS